MQQYLAKIKELIRDFEECIMEYIPREQNARADLLSKQASTRTMVNNRSIIQVVKELSILARPPLNICSTE